MVPDIIGKTQRDNQCLSSWDIDINTLDDCRFKFCQTGFMRKILEATGMEYCNGLPTLTKIEAPLGTDVNGSEAKKDWPNSYAYF